MFLFSRNIVTLAGFLLYISIFLVLIGGFSKNEKILNPGLIMLSVGLSYFIAILIYGTLRGKQTFVHDFIDKILGNPRY